MSTKISTLAIKIIHRKKEYNMARLEVLNKDEIDVVFKNLDTGKIMEIEIYDYPEETCSWIKIGDILTGSRSKSFEDIYGDNMYVYQIENKAENENLNLFYSFTEDDLARVSPNKLLWQIGLDGDSFRDSNGELIVDKVKKLKSNFPLYTFEFYEDDSTLSMSLETGKVKVFDNAVRQVEKYLKKLI